MAGARAFQAGAAGGSAFDDRDAARGEWAGSDFDIGGLELNTPVWANEMHEYPYLQWSMEVHRAKLKASYPLAADKIQMGGPNRRMKYTRGRPA